MSGKLSIEGLSVEGRTPSGQWATIVRSVDVEVKRGQVVALIGESGAGKTTVALTALGYCRPGTRAVGGHVYLDGSDLLALDQTSLRGIRGRRVAYVAQSAAAALNPRIPVGKQILECLQVHGLDKGGAEWTRIIDLLRLMRLPDPERMVTRYPHQVSGGQRQRLMVAMAMACSPEFLVLDEPTTALDVTTQIEVLKTIADVMRTKGSGAIYVSHDLAVVAQVADYVVVMHDGQVVEETLIAGILADPREEYTRKLLAAVRSVPARVNRRCEPEGIGVADGDRMIRITDVRASYQKRTWLHPICPDQHALRSVSLSIDPGEVVALVGESGSGKSTLARVLAGLMSPLSGTVQFRGRPLDANVRQRKRDDLRKIQIVFQNPDMTLNPSKTVEDAVGRPLSLYFGLKGRPRRERVEELLALVELPAAYADRYPGELSGGQKQRVALARALGAEPDLIICDEVLSSLDNLVAATILELLKDLRERLGLAYLFISHDLATVAAIADRVVVMYAGRVCEEGTAQEVFSPPYHPYTSLLIDSVPELRRDWLSDILDEREAERSPSDSDAQPGAGCAFAGRCPLVVDGLCQIATPAVRKLGRDDRHIIHCHRDIVDLVAAAGERKSVAE